MKNNNYIPAPSPQEEAVAKGNYDEYRRQQEAEPKTMGEVIKSADPDSVLGKIRDIQNDIHYSKWKVSDGHLITDDEEEDEYEYETRGLNGSYDEYIDEYSDADPGL